jgi:hypothetical protein
MKLFKTYSIIIFCSVIFSFFFFFTCKIVIKKLYPYSKEVIEEYKNDTGKNFDTRSRFKIYKDLSKNNPNVMVSIPATSFLKNNIIPLSGVSNILTVNCNENGYYSKYKSDRYGFNNPDEEWSKKNIEYLLIGDSMVHGFCVNRPNDIASILRKLTAKPVLNLGYGGNGPLVEYATLREYIKPDIKNIIWFYYEGNDFLNLEKELKSEILNQYVVDYNFTQNLKNRQKEINFIVEDYLDVHYNLILRLYYSLKESVIKELPITDKFHKENVKKALLTKKFLNIINFAKKLSLENNSNFFFVYLPELTRYKNKKFKNNLYIEIKKHVEELGISFIDIDKEVFKKENDPLKLFPFRRYSHYTVEGYNKIAKSIFNFVSQTNIKVETLK